MLMSMQDGWGVWGINREDVKSKLADANCQSTHWLSNAGGNGASRDLPSASIPPAF